MSLSPDSIPLRARVLSPPRTFTPGAAEPCTAGVPLPRGWCRDAASVRLRAADGTLIASQRRALARWGDESVKWLLLDFQARVPGDGEIVAWLEASAESSDPAPAAPIGVDAAGGRATVTSGVRVTADPGDERLFDVLTASGLRYSVVASAEDVDGKAARVRVTGVSVEDAGPLRAVVRLDGRIDLSGRALEIIARVHLYAQVSAVRCDLTVRNPSRARHPGGVWELGDPGSTLFRALSIAVTRADPVHVGHADGSIVPGTIARWPLPLRIDQASSGGERWNGSVHVNRAGRIPLRFCGYEITTASTTERGRRATPVVSLGSGSDRVSIAQEHFWQNCPKAVAADRDRIVWQLWPADAADPHELQGGEQKTDTLFIAWEDDPIAPVPLDWARQPVSITPDPEYVCATGAVPYLTPSAGASPEYVALTDAAVAGPDSFVAKRERIDEYGWRHFGDVYGDHEAVFHRGAEPLVSHYNNQYDPVLGFGAQFLRSGDVRWWRHMRELAAHVVDIDIYHTAEDKSAYNRGLFWHTVHYVDAGKSTHRTYPREGGMGGGPASEHNYAAGLLLYHYLTGDRAAREAARDLAEFPIRIDDGSTTVFRWLARGATGLATASGSPLYHGPGRGSGNSLSALVDGHALTGEERFLAKAEEIIRRVVHPADDVEALNLLDAERKWFYTMFLQALGKYLDHKADRGQRDGMYAYARASLLHYARWMAAHEYPYLDKPDILEYPTETWAAQDIRKSDAFFFAARHADGEDRARFIERAEFFFKESVGRLSAMPTRTLARPVIVLLTSGWLRDWHAAHPDAAADRPAPGGEAFGAPARFEPQKRRALRRAKQIAAALSLVGAAVLGGLAMWLF